MTAENIDVLTVMQEAAYGLALADERSYGAGDDLLKARAAVAELIEKGEELVLCLRQDAYLDTGRNDFPENSPTGEFIAALARVGAP